MEKGSPDVSDAFIRPVSPVVSCPMKQKNRLTNVRLVTIHHAHVELRDRKAANMLWQKESCGRVQNVKRMITKSDLLEAPVPLPQCKCYIEGLSPTLSAAVLAKPSTNAQCSGIGNALHQWRCHSFQPYCLKDSILKKKMFVSKKRF